MPCNARNGFQVTFIIRKVLWINYFLQDKVTTVYSQMVIISISLTSLNAVLRAFRLTLVFGATL